MSEPGTDTASLMRAFSESRSSDAFTTLVRRYLPVVYAAALRRSGNPTIADDVSQLVFIDFAKRLPTLRPDERIGAWLHRAATFRAGDVMRSERRRKQREEKAAAMLEIESLPQSDRWQALSPIVDEALARLRKPDREILILHYFEGKKLRNIAEAIGITEAAAKKRCSRAVSKLRSKLNRRGAAVGIGALGTLLGSGIAEGATASANIAPAVGGIAQAALGKVSAGGAAVWWFRHGPLFRFVGVGALATLVCGSLPILAQLNSAPDTQSPTASTDAKAGSQRLTALRPKTVPRPPMPDPLPPIDGVMTVPEIVDRLDQICSAPLSELDSLRCAELFAMIPKPQSGEAILLMDSSWSDMVKRRTNQWRIQLCREWGKHEPALATSWVLEKLKPGSIEYIDRIHAWNRIIGTIVGDWAYKDWDAAWNFVRAGFDDGSLLVSDKWMDIAAEVTSAVGYKLAQKEGLRPAIDLIAQMQRQRVSGIPQMNGLGAMISKARSDDDFTYFLDVAASLPSPLDRKNMRSGILERWIRTSPSAAREFIHQLPNAEERAAAAWAMGLGFDSSTGKNAFPVDEIGAHLDWIIEQSPTPSERARAFEVGDILMHWMIEAPAAATEWQLQHPSYAKIAARKIIATWEGRKRNSVRQLTPEWKSGAQRLLKNWEALEPELYAKHVDTLRVYQRENDPRDFKAAVEDLLPSEEASE